MICTIKDFEKVYNVLASPDLAGDITDDNSGSMFDVVKSILVNPSIMVLMPSNGTVFTLTCLNSILYEAHLITTNSDKKDVCGNTLSACEWVKKNTAIERFISHIPVNEESTLHYSAKIGMEYIGTIPAAYAKNGKRVDVNIVGCSVDEIIRRLSWQQQRQQ